MTFREKLQQEHPALDWEHLDKIVSHDCPCEHGYEDRFECADNGMTCRECWKREMPGTGPVKETGFTEEEIKMLKEAAEKAQAFEAKMNSGEWVQTGDFKWRCKEDGSRQFIYTGPKSEPKVEEEPDIPKDGEGVAIGTAKINYCLEIAGDSTEEIMLQSAKVIAAECRKRENCDGCIFETGEYCSIADRPDLWNITLAKLAELEERAEQ